MTSFSEEQIIRAIEKAPSAVQDAITDAKTVKTIAAIGTKYQLHVDTIGVLAQLNRNMLIGLMSPSEVLEKLTTQGVSGETARIILAELNEKIFAPLHQQVMGLPVARQSVAPLKVEMSDASQVTTPAPPMPDPVPAPQLQKLETSSTSLDTPRPVSASAASPSSFVPSQIIASASTTASLAASPTRAALPTQPRQSLPSVPRNEGLHEVLKKYGVDPYREPLD